MVSQLYKKLVPGVPRLEGQEPELVQPDQRRDDLTGGRAEDAALHPRRGLEARARDPGEEGGGGSGAAVLQDPVHSARRQRHRGQGLVGQQLITVFKAILLIYHI